MQQITGEGIQVLVPRDAGLRKGARAGWTGGMYSIMRSVLATPHGRDLYGQRQVTIEPVFGQIKSNRALKRFQRRGRTACRSEWRLIAGHAERAQAPQPSTGRRETLTGGRPFAAGGSGH
jgi:Transposase DDE domain